MTTEDGEEEIKEKGRRKINEVKEKTEKGEENWDEDERKRKIR